MVLVVNGLSAFWLGEVDVRSLTLPSFSGVGPVLGGGGNLVTASDQAYIRSS